MKKALLIVCVCLPFILCGQTMPLDGVVVYLPFDGNALDQSGNGNDAIVDGATLTEDRHGNTDAAYFFNGEDNLMTIADDPMLHMSSVSLLLWATFLDQPTNQRNFISKPVGNWTSDSYVFWYQVNGISGHIGNIEGAGYFSHYEWVPELETWYFLAYTYDETSQMQTLYIDGENVVSDYTEPSIGWDDHPVMIGAESDIEETVYWHYGKIDDILIYNRALTAQEIADLYQSYYSIEEKREVISQVSVYPNPFAEYAKLEFTLQAREEIKCELISVSGVKRMTILNNMLIPGVYKVNLPSDQLKPGIYYLMIRTSQHSYPVKIIKLI